MGQSSNTLAHGVFRITYNILSQISQDELTQGGAVMTQVNMLEAKTW